jgi:UDPglucose 6-dehydrogenase
MLIERGARVQAYDPQSEAHAEAELPEVAWKPNAIAALEKADALVVLTEWNEFRGLDLREARNIMRGDVIVDLRNIFRPEMARDAGFRYLSVGRPDSNVILKMVRDTAA